MRLTGKCYCEVWVNRFLKVRSILGLASVAAIVAFSSGCSHTGSAERSYIAEKGVEADREAMAAYRGEDYQKARDKFLEALRIDRSIGNRGAELKDLVYIGKSSVALGDYPTALNYLYDAVRVGTGISDDKNLSEAYFTIARADYLTADHAAALDSVDESINLDKKLGTVSAAKLNLKAQIYTKSGRTIEASSILEKAIEINKTGRDGLEMADSYRAKADLLYSEENYEDALKYYMDALDIDKSHGDTRKVALDLEKMGELRAKNGEVKDAIYLFERSYIVRLNSHQTTEALNCLDRIIEAYRSMGNEEKAGFYAKIKLSVIENSADRKAGIR
jgi:tetratricopeptide (TPR) repeat protein